MSEITAAVRAELSLLTPDQVCELLQVKKDWLYDEVQRGRMPHVRLGRRLRFTPENLRAYLAGEWQQQVTAPVTAPVRRGRPRKN
jgi:excisionase family DNA binding protein